MRALEDRSPFDGPEIVEEQRRARSQGGNMKATEFELWKEDNCECGIADETGEWSAELFEEFGCNCNESHEARRKSLMLNIKQDSRSSGVAVLLDAVLKRKAAGRVEKERQKQEERKALSCETCAYCKPGEKLRLYPNYEWEYAKCTHPKLGGYYCTTMRDFDCGKKGKFHSERPPVSSSITKLMKRFASILTSAP